MSRLLSIAALMMLATACADRTAEPPPPPPSDEISFRIDGTLSFIRDADTLRTIDLEIAADDSSRQRGMMQRTSFPDDTGMLFVFDNEEM